MPEVNTRTDTKSLLQLAGDDLDEAKDIEIRATNSAAPGASPSHRYVLTVEGKEVLAERPSSRTSTFAVEVRVPESRDDKRLAGGLRSVFRKLHRASATDDSCSRRSPRTTVSEDLVTMNRRKTPFKVRHLLKHFSDQSPVNNSPGPYALQAN